MSDTAQSNQQQLKSLINVFLGTSLIFWILSVFIIVQVYKLNTSLNDIKLQMQNAAGANQELSNFQVVDVDGKVVYSFVAVPPPPMDEMDMPMAPGGQVPPGMPGTVAPAKAAPTITAPPADPIPATETAPTDGM